MTSAQINRDPPSVDRRYGAAIAWVIALGIWAVVQLGPTLTPYWALHVPDYLSHIRNFGYGDQLSYLSIGANAANGLPAFTEPFTATGTLYYPAAYYVGLGWLARLTRIDLMAAWNLIGLWFSAGLVVSCGVFAARVVRRPWAPVLGVLPFVLGTLSTALEGGWISVSGTRSVIWAPFVALYSLNGEIAGLVIGIAGLMLIVDSMLRSEDGLPSGRQPLLGGVAIGAVAAIHAYAFLTAAVVVMYLFAFAWLRAFAGRSTWWLSAFALGLVPLIGHAISQIAGPSAAIAALLVPVLPGATAALRRLGPLALAPLGAVVMAASPQLINTARAVLTADPYLDVRESINSSLALPISTAVLLNIPLLALILLVALPTPGATTPTDTGRTVAIAIGLTWMLLSFNNAWGFSQEPYRFSINVLMVAVALLPTFALLRFTRRAPSEGWPGRVVGSLLIVTVLLGLLEVPRFWSDMRRQSLVSRLDDQSLQAIAPMLDGHLVMIDSCIDPYVFKVQSGQRIAWYVPAIALPDHEPELARLVAASRNQTLDVAAAIDASVTRVVTQVGCPGDSQMESEPRAEWLGGTDRSPAYRVWELSP